MHQGRLYVFDSFVCFYSNVFGIEQRAIIPLQSVVSVFKAYTAKVVPNAVEITSTGDRKDFFCSFIQQDKAYRLICAAWCNSSPAAVDFFRLQQEEREAKERAAAAEEAARKKKARRAGARAGKVVAAGDADAVLAAAPPDEVADLGPDDV